MTVTAVLSWLSRTSTSSSVPEASVSATPLIALSRSMPSEKVNVSEPWGSNCDRFGGVPTTNGFVLSLLMGPTLYGSSCGGTGALNVAMVAPVAGFVTYRRIFGTLKNWSTWLPSG